MLKEDSNIFKYTIYILKYYIYLNILYTNPEEFFKTKISKGMAFSYS